MDIAALVSQPSSASSSAAESKAAREAQENQDRFLKLLVAQMKNQDPMNPMENAELTTQIAQIQTVTGIDNLNTAIAQLNSSFGQNQAYSAVAMVGRNVSLPGNRMLMARDGAQGAFDLAAAADRVQVEIVNSAGAVVDTVDLGAASKGRHVFNWAREGLSSSDPLQFRVKAMAGAKELAVTSYSRDQVVAVNTADGKLGFELASGQRSDFSAFVWVD